MAKVATNQDRLNSLFNADPRNDTAIADALGVSKQTISAWRNGSRSPKKSVLLRIAEFYHTSPEWLLGWDLPAPQIISPEASLTFDALSEEEQALITAFRSARPEYQSIVMEILTNHQREVDS